MAKSQFFVSLFGLVGLGTIVACQPMPGVDTVTQSLPIPSNAECPAAGGTVQKVGLLGNEMCVVPTADAGKSCSDSSQCEGRCILDDWGDAGPPSPGTKVTGICQRTNMEFGCWGEVRDGKLYDAVKCVD